MAEAPELRLSDLHDLFAAALHDPRVQLQRGLSPKHMAVEDRWRVFFSAKCRCGVSALLYVDISKDRTRAEIEEKMGSLLAGLSAQADQFYRMPCEMHQRMQLR